MNLGYLLANATAKYPGATALVATEGRFTFSELERRSAALAGALLAQGFSPGDRVAFLFHNCARLVETYLAVVRAGLVATPLNFRFTPRELIHLINDSGSRALVYAPGFQDHVEAMAGQIPGVELLVRPGGANDPPALDYEEFLAGGGRPSTWPLVEEGRPCQIMYTSGTTGRPKGAVITHRNVIWNLHNTIHGREDRAGQRSLIVGPLYHTAALNNHLTIQLALGGLSVLIEKFEPQELLRIIQEEKATVVSGSPAMYNLLLSHPRAGDYDTSSITKCTAGADKLPMETKRRLMKFFPKLEGIYDVYGCTEASPSITILSARDSLERDLSVGRALPFLNARLMDPQGALVPPGEVGELVCQGPNVMQGYHNQPQASAEALKDGWLHTGDLARMDQDGFFYIVDRKKDMIVSGGENIYPRELEEVLFSHPQVEDVAVVGMPDPLWGESVRAVIVARPGSNLDQEQVIEFCRQHLAGYKKPRRVDFVAELPRNASGKVLKRKLQAHDKE